MRDARTGLRFAAPRNWLRRARGYPGIFRIASGEAEVSGWAYARQDVQLPRTRADLEAARDALARRARERDRTFRLSSSAITTVRGAPAIELRGSQEIGGTLVRTRSVHVYRNGEYVFEVIAPARQFALADERVLEPLLRSLRFRPPPS